MQRSSRYCFALAAAISANVGTLAEPHHIAREAIEWCNIWIPNANETKLLRVLLIGDSITGGYGPKVQEALKGKASVARLTSSKSTGDPVLLMEVALVLGQCRFDVVHFSNGLHTGLDAGDVLKHGGAWLPSAEYVLPFLHPLIGASRWSYTEQNRAVELPLRPSGQQSPSPD